MKKAALIKCIDNDSTLNKRSACRAAGISKTAYYHEESDKKKEEDEYIIGLLKQLPAEILNKRGSKAKTKELYKRFGIVLNHKRIERICRENGLLSSNRVRKHPKGYYKQQKESKKEIPQNILNRDFNSDEPMKKLCSDVTYFKTTDGWLYLSAVLDLHRRKIVSYIMSKHNDEKLALDTMEKLRELGELKGLLFHTDQGSIYFGIEFRKKIKEYGIVQSMSRRGNCWDNACMEHFFGTLKVESGYDECLNKKLMSYENTKKLIEDFIYYYNNERIQKNLNWQAPNGAAA